MKSIPVVFGRLLLTLLLAGLSEALCDNEVTGRPWISTKIETNYIWILYKDLLQTGFLYTQYYTALLPYFTR